MTHPTSKQQVDSAIRFTATEADLKAIRAAFEAVNPGARGWRKPDEKSAPEYEYYSPLARGAFYNFRDGWLAAKASGETAETHARWGQALAQLTNGFKYSAEVCGIAREALGLTVKTTCELGIESHRGCDCKKPAPPTCAKHGVELAFEGDGCWECSKEER